MTIPERKYGMPICLKGEDQRARGGRLIPREISDIKMMDVPLAMNTECAPGEDIGRDTS
jgi:hypothetical protein